MVGATSKMKVDGKCFGKMGNTGGIIQKDNSAGHSFVLRDLGSIKKTLVKLNRFWPLRGRRRRGGGIWQIIGSTTVPWGTPNVTDTDRDSSPDTTTF